MERKIIGNLVHSHEIHPLSSNLVLFWSSWCMIHGFGIGDLYFQSIHLKKLLWMPLDFSDNIYGESLGHPPIPIKRRWVQGWRIIQVNYSLTCFHGECYPKVLFFWEVFSSEFWRGLCNPTLFYWKLFRVCPMTFSFTSNGFPCKSCVSFLLLSHCCVIVYLLSPSTHCKN